MILKSLVLIIEVIPHYREMKGLDHGPASVVAEITMDDDAFVFLSIINHFPNCFKNGTIAHVRSFLREWEPYVSHISVSKKSCSILILSFG